MSYFQQERRAYRRWTLACPVTITQKDGRFYARGRTLNVCDGGAFVEIPPGQPTPSVTQAELSLLMSVPRSTANTHMMEDFQATARIVRVRPANGENFALALEFSRPLDLGLEDG